MKINLKHLLAIFFISAASVCLTQRSIAQEYHEQYRPQFHFSPKAHWVNDPNGMVYYNGTYHLFFQYYPKDIVWGPMHWGHAVSKDLIHWKQLPIALYPDSLGYIFSGSAVIDYNNTSGFGKNGKTPMVAIFTSHDPVGEKAGKDNFENESIAYSLDGGNNWTKYNGNPVLKNPGIRDFRDPKVSWYPTEKKWIMTLATKDHITFYSAPNLKNWKKESEFGLNEGAHGGVWECPDLFPLKLNDKTYWVLIVNLNPGGPNGGSATQYFVGNFDGIKFIPIDTQTRWLDYGPDEYAGITWSNTGNRKVFLSWMSNWQYANQVPTKTWRSTMTVPRELALKQSTKGIVLASEPVKELDKIKSQSVVLTNLSVTKTTDLSAKIKNFKGQYILKLSAAQLENFEVKISNIKGEELLIGFDKTKNEYYIDRTNAGKADFSKDFKGRFTSPRITASKNADITLLIDKASVELFADGGLTTMTTIYFPTGDFNKLSLSAQKLKVSKLSLTGLASIWK